MKKLLVFLMGIMLMLGVSSCKCTKDVEPVEPVVEFAEAAVAADRAQMDELADTYKWFETRVEYDNAFDADTTLTVTKVESLFQVAVEDSLGVKTFVYDFIHYPDVEEPELKQIEGFILDDKPLNDEQIVLTFSEALERLYEANLPTPNSTKVVLRKALGPNPGVNAQYIFGTPDPIGQLVFVDAVTGDVTDNDPVYEYEPKVEE